MLDGHMSWLSNDKGEESFKFISGGSRDSKKMILNFSKESIRK